MLYVIKYMVAKASSENNRTEARFFSQEAYPAYEYENPNRGVMLLGIYHGSWEHTPQKRPSAGNRVLI